MRVSLRRVVMALLPVLAIVGRSNSGLGATYRSCQFDGNYSSGCVEYTQDHWSKGEAFKHCKNMCKDGVVPKVVDKKCKRNTFNTMCRSEQSKNRHADIYANNIPSFICWKYMDGELFDRPEEGWKNDLEVATAG